MKAKPEGSDVFIRREEKDIILQSNKIKAGTCLVVQWLRLHTSIARGIGLIPARGIKTLYAAKRNERLRGDTTETIKS